MERIDNLELHSFQYSVDTFRHSESISELHAYDFELGSQFSGSQTRGNDPLAVLSKSSDSSLALSDDYVYSPDELRRLSHSNASSEGTISPKDTVLYNTSELPETVGYFSQPTPLFKNSPMYETPAHLSPISPRPAIRPVPRVRADLKPQKDAPQAGPVRRRATKTNSVAANAPSGVCNHNNSKPITAREMRLREKHNAAAMRSRIRLNETLDKIWKTIPVSRRLKQLNSEGAMDLDEDEEERIGRAEELEVGIDYIIYLEERVKELEQRVGRVH